jgi:hypothetical protein
MDVEGPSAWTLVPMVRMLRPCVDTSRAPWRQALFTGEGCGETPVADGQCPHSPL